MNVTDSDLSHYLTWDVSGGAFCALARLRFVDGAPDDARLELAARDEVRVGLYFSSGTECFAVFLPPITARHSGILRRFGSELLHTRPELVDERDGIPPEGGDDPLELWAGAHPDDRHVPYTLSCVCNALSLPGLTAHVLGELGEHSAVSIYPASPAPASSVTARLCFRLLELEAVRTLVGSLYRTAAAVACEIHDREFDPPPAFDLGLPADFTPPEDYTP